MYVFMHIIKLICMLYMCMGCIYYFCTEGMQANSMHVHTAVSCVLHAFSDMHTCTNYTYTHVRRSYTYAIPCFQHYTHEKSWFSTCNIENIGWHGYKDKFNTHYYIHRSITSSTCSGTSARNSQKTYWQYLCWHPKSNLDLTRLLNYGTVNYWDCCFCPFCHLSPC